MRPGRFLAAAVAIVVVQLVAVSVIGNAVPTSARLPITADWSTSATGCASDPNATVQVHYTIRYDNLAGPSGYAIMALGFGGHMRRYWATYVPADTFQQPENGTVWLRCGQAPSFLIVLLSTVPS